MGTGSSPPPAPDPLKTSAAQTGSNIQTATANTYLNNPDVITPYGTTTTQRTGYETITLPDGTTQQVPRFTQTQSLSQAEQGFLNQQNQIRGNVNQIGIDQSAKIGNLLGTNLDLSGLSIDPNSFSQDRQRVEQALFDRINPQNERDYAALENRLTNQGFQRGTEAFNSAMDEYRRGINDQRLGITARGLQEQQGLYGIASNAATNEIQRRLTERNQPINEITQLMGLGAGQGAQFQPYQGGQVANADVAGNIYNSAALANQAWQQEQANKNALIGGLFGLGQAGILGATKYMSDRRLKRGIRDLGVRLMNGVKLYAYRYLWDDREHVGVMADELARVRPDAVSSHGGYLAVNYGAL